SWTIFRLTFTFMPYLILTPFEATQPLRFYLASNILIELIKFMPYLFKTQFDATQPLRFVLKRYA
ncbi:hypothetical protein, partial [Globicatella sp. HMSC072A10]|uniref:hypothetical protein n=1 Tax=Globicatella sp. HMSC072A10 TaxID=1739315 RepID=UPI001AEFAB2F